MADDGLLGGLDAWTTRHLPTLAELESGWVRAIAGDTLLHGDLRTDNTEAGKDDHSARVLWRCSIAGR